VRGKNGGASFQFGDARPFRATRQIVPVYPNMFPVHAVRERSFQFTRHAKR